MIPFLMAKSGFFGRGLSFLPPPASVSDRLYDIFFLTLHLYSSGQGVIPYRRL